MILTFESYHTLNTSSSFAYPSCWYTGKGDYDRLYHEVASMWPTPSAIADDNDDMNYDSLLEESQSIQDDRTHFPWSSSNLRWW